MTQDPPDGRSDAPDAVCRLRRFGGRAIDWPATRSGSSRAAVHLGNFAWQTDPHDFLKRRQASCASSSGARKVRRASKLGGRTRTSPSRPIDFPHRVVLVHAIVLRHVALLPPHDARLVAEVPVDPAEHRRRLHPDDLLVVEDAEIAPDALDVAAPLVRVPAVDRSRVGVRLRSSWWTTAEVPDHRPRKDLRPFHPHHHKLAPCRPLPR